MGFKRDFAKKELAVVGIVGDLHFGMRMIFFFWRGGGAFENGALLLF